MPRERFRIHDEATKEITDAIRWFAERDEKLADRFIVAVNNAIDSVVASPERFAKYRFRTRYAPVTGFHYIVVFCVVDDLVHVVAAPHTSRRPGYWRDRLCDIE